MTSVLRGHLVASRLAGEVATPVKACLDNCRKMLEGDPDHTFGLSGWRAAGFDAALGALAACGVSLQGGRFPVVDPSVALAAVDEHRRGFAAVAAAGGRVLLATGHAFALLPHYQALARALADAGCAVLQPFDGERAPLLAPDGQPASVRYFSGVAALVVHGSVVHTHRPDYMGAMLAALGGADQVDAVFADHGYAGAAIEAGVATYSIADVNDPALPLAQSLGLTSGVLVVDDGLVPSAYEPVTAAILGGGLGHG